MRSTRVLAVAALLALPFGTTASVAAPASPGAAKAASGLDTARLPLVHVKKGGGGGGFKGGGFKGGAFRGGGGRPAFSGSPRSPMATLRGGGRSVYRGGRPGGWGAVRGRGKGYAYHKGKHHRHKFRGRYFVGYPYFYNYGPYYYDDYYYYDDGGYDDDAVARCAARYRSFDPATGTYLHVSGERRRCPYL